MRDRTYSILGVSPSCRPPERRRRQVKQRDRLMSLLASTAVESGTSQEEQVKLFLNCALILGLMLGSAAGAQTDGSAASSGAAATSGNDISSSPTSSEGAGGSGTAGTGTAQENPSGTESTTGGTTGTGSTDNVFGTMPQTGSTGTETTNSPDPGGG